MKTFGKIAFFALGLTSLSQLSATLNPPVPDEGTLILQISAGTEEEEGNKSMTDWGDCSSCKKKKKK
jgi:hypothetical protein